ncbi:MAG: MFS transporter [Caldilineaceae bacterium]|nr:MFS transporter [Caldilineaceae bacterium]
MSVFSQLTRPFQPAQPIPEAYRKDFWHLYMDVAWFGILSGTSLAFLTVYAARLGASGLQIGLINAGPAVVGLLFTLPVGRWLQDRPVGGAVFWSAALTRSAYLLWALIPAFLAPQPQVWTLIVLVLVMTIPSTVLAVGFNALYASAVPPEWRGHVVGVRNALLSVVFVASSLLAGYLLDRLPFALGYQLIFLLGFVGAAMSTYHLWRLRHISGETVAGPPQIRGVIGDFARGGEMRSLGLNARATVALRSFTRGVQSLRPGVLRGHYGIVIFALFLFHLALFLPVPIFPLYWVNQLHFSDGVISVGTAVFHLAVLFGSLRVSQLVSQWGNHRLTAIGALLLSLYPLLLAFTQGLPLFLVTSFLGGAAWALVGGAVGNYLLEKVPNTDRPASLAWYNLALNAAVLLGSLGGSWLADAMNLSAALIVCFVARVLAGLVIWRVR